jgi:glycerophosphoryl diester phosphodiesterase
MAQDLPKLIAHRGASHEAPENTMAAFRLAWEQGADGIEADFLLSKDGHAEGITRHRVWLLETSKIQRGVNSHTERHPRYLAERQMVFLGNKRYRKNCHADRRDSSGKTGE